MASSAVRSALVNRVGKRGFTEVGSDESMQHEKLNEILSELAYDLDFYEPNEEWKNESPSYYGDERLEELVKLGIQKIQDFNKAP